MTTPKERQRALAEVLEQRVLVLDGAMGTMLQQRHLTAADFGGPALEGCNENLVRTRPDVVLDIHRAYFAAGADIVETNTFGAHRPRPRRVRPRDDAHELNRLAAQLARQAAAEFSTTAKPRFVAGSIGPTTKAITVAGGVTFPQLIDAYLRAGQGSARRRRRHPPGRNLQRHAQRQGRAHRHRAAARRTRRAPSPSWSPAPSKPSAPCSPARPPTPFAPRSSHADLLSIGLNCGTGPEFMTDHLRTIADMAPSASPAIPTPACPTRKAATCETPDALAAQLERFLAQRLAQHRRRLLRHHRRPHQRHRPDGRRPAPAPHPRARRIAPGIPASSWWKPKRATAR